MVFLDYCQTSFYEIKILKQTLYAIRRVSSSEDTELRQGLRQRFRMDDPDRGKPRNRLQERKFESFVVKITV